MKKFLSLLLVAIMLLAVVPFYAFTASAADDYMGEEPENPMAAFVISTDGGYIAGAPLTVTVTVKDVKFERGLNALMGSFYYDNSVLTLENGTLSSGYLDCLTKAPGGSGSEWFQENISKVEADGTITLATMGGITESNIYAKDGDIVFTLNFTVAEGTTGHLLFYITNTDCTVMGDDNFAIQLLAKGASLTVCEDISEDSPSEEPSYEEPSYEEPSYEEPSYEEPSYEEPSYEEPSYEEPSYDEPSDEDISNEESTPADDYMGEEPENSMAAFVISTDGGYIAGAPLTVTVTVKDVKFEKGLNFLMGSFYYDNSVLTLENGTLGSGSLDCLTKAPGGSGSEWYKENFSKVEADGTITLATMGGIAESDIYAKDGDIVFTLNFTVAEGTTGDLLFYITNPDCFVMGDDDFATQHPVAGASLTVCEIPCSLGHDYEAVRTEPTCTEDGYTTYTCTRCGDSYVHTRTDPISLGASYTAKNSRTDAWADDGKRLTDGNKGSDDISLGYAGFLPDTEVIIDLGSAQAARDFKVYLAAGLWGIGVPQNNWRVDVHYSDSKDGTYKFGGSTTEPVLTSGSGTNDETCSTYVMSVPLDTPVCARYFKITITNTWGGHLWVDEVEIYDVYENGSLGHDYETVAVTAPTCTEDGYTTYTCTRCGDSYTNIEGSLGHNYESVRTEPTCTEDGYEINTCTRCGDSYTNVLTASGHVYGESWEDSDNWIVDDAGCVTFPNAYGYVFDITSVNGIIAGEDATIIDNADNYAACNPNWAISVALVATETEGVYSVLKVVVTPGSASGADINWDETDLVLVVHSATCDPAEELQFPNWRSKCAAMALNIGDRVCYDEEAATVTVLGGHSLVVTAPTCTEGGYTTYTCARCEYSYIADEIDALGHDYDSVVTAPTCTEGGYTTHTCATCGDSYVDSEVAALGHLPGPEADCENDQICLNNCGLVYEEAHGHKYDRFVTLPNCTEGGYTLYVCSVCKDGQIGDIVAALGHDYDSVVTEPTCTEGGYTTHTCATCGDVLVDSYVDALGHTYITKVVKPTCTEQGYSEHTCSGCDKVIVDSYVDALGHTEGEWETLPNGNLELSCDVCGELLDSKIIYAEGDINGDGKVNLFDYVALKSHVLGKSPLSEDKLVRADVNGDGRINMFDYVALKTLVVKG